MLVLEADDQLLVQLVPLNCAANGPLRKLCICEAVIVEAVTPSVVSVDENAVSIAVLAADVVEEK